MSERAYRDAQGAHLITLYGTMEIEIEYLATVIHCPEEGDGCSEPWVPAHCELEDIQPLSVTLHENGEEVDSTNATAAMALAQHILDQVDPRDILRELNDSEVPR